MSRVGIDRDDEEDQGRRPRRRGMNPAIVILIVLATALPFLAGGAYVIYRVITRDERVPAVNSATSTTSTTKAPVAGSNLLEKYRKRLIGRWETDVTKDGVTRHINIEFRSDGTQVAWGFADGRRSETSGRWEALKVENGQLLLRTVVSGITRETFYSFPSANEYRYTMSDGREIVARRAK